MRQAAHSLQWCSETLSWNLAWVPSWSVCGKDVQSVPHLVSKPGLTAKEALSLGSQLGLARARCWDAVALLLPVPLWGLPPCSHAEYGEAGVPAAGSEVCRNATKGGAGPWQETLKFLLVCARPQCLQCYCNVIMTAFMRRHSFTYSVARQRSLTFLRTVLQNLLPQGLCGIHGRALQGYCAIGSPLVCFSWSVCAVHRCGAIQGFGMSELMLTGGASQITEGTHKAEQRL